MIVAGHGRQLRTRKRPLKMYLFRVAHQAAHLDDFYL